MYCRNCGKEVRPDANFCTFCGTPVIKEPISVNPANNEAGNRAVSEPAAPVSAKGKRSGGFPIKTVIIVTVLFLAGIIASSVMTRPPEGALNQTFKVAYILPSEYAYFSDHIYLPVFDTVYINTSEYEENGFGIPTEEDASKGVWSCMTIECNKDNTFEMHFFDEHAYGNYYYDKDDGDFGQVTFYMDGNEYYASYEEGILSLDTEDGSRFVFYGIK